MFYGVKPDEKKKFVSGLQKDQKIVAMVGDGINDTAALASSHVGVAMGDGAGAASEVSSIVLMGNRLSQVFSSLSVSSFNLLRYMLQAYILVYLQVQDITCKSR